MHNGTPEREKIDFTLFHVDSSTLEAEAPMEYLFIALRELIADSASS